MADAPRPPRRLWQTTEVTETGARIETQHPSEYKAYEAAHASLEASMTGANRVIAIHMYHWEDGRWCPFDTFRCKGGNA